MGNRALLVKAVPRAVVAEPSVMGTTAAVERPVGTLSQPAKSAGLWHEASRRLLRSRLATVSAILLALLTLIAIFAPFVAPYDYTAQDYSALTEPPSQDHWLGTDDLGRDILSRLIFGARISLAVGLVVQAVILLIGVPAGLIAAHFGGKVDTVIMRTVDALYSIPSLLFVIVIMTFLRATLATASNGFTQALASIDSQTGGLIGVFIGIGLDQLDASRSPGAGSGGVPEGKGIRRGRTRQRRQQRPNHDAALVTERRADHRRHRDHRHPAGDHL